MIHGANEDRTGAAAVSTAVRDHRIQSLIGDHQAAVRDYLLKAQAIPESGWLTPRAEGKWTPAQETRHLILAYEAFSADLRGERKMGLKGTPLRRALWRLFGLTSILWRRKIPVAVRAPREARPDWETTPRDPLLLELRERAEQLDAVFAETWRADPRRRVTHPFFGDLKLEHAITLSAVHTRHHAAFLPVP